MSSAVLLISIVTDRLSHESVLVALVIMSAVVVIVMLMDAVLVAIRMMRSVVVTRQVFDANRNRDAQKQRRSEFAAVVMVKRDFRQQVGQCDAEASKRQNCASMHFLPCLSAWPCFGQTAGTDAGQGLKVSQKSTCKK